jgi:hypothetical protein
MSKHFLRVPPGARVEIFNRAGDPVAAGALLEDWTISVNSQYKQVIEDRTPDLLTYTGAAVASLTNGRFGFSGEFKQFGFAHWTGTDVANFNFSLEFYMTYSGLEEVAKPIARIKRLVVPAESLRFPGNLLPVGPSIVDALSESSSDVLPKNNAPAPDEIDVPVSNDYSSDDSYVNIRVGAMLFKRLIIKQAESTVSKNVDTDGYPIYGRIAVQAQTMFIPTKEDVREWLGV